MFAFTPLFDRILETAIKTQQELQELKKPGWKRWQEIYKPAIDAIAQALDLEGVEVISKPEEPEPEPEPKIEYLSPNVVQKGQYFALGCNNKQRLARWVKNLGKVGNHFIEKDEGDLTEKKWVLFCTNLRRDRAEWIAENADGLDLEPEVVTEETPQQPNADESTDQSNESEPQPQPDKPAVVPVRESQQSDQSDADTDALMFQKGAKVKVATDRFIHLGVEKGAIVTLIGHPTAGAVGRPARAHNDLGEPRVVFLCSEEMEKIADADTADPVESKIEPEPQSCKDKDEEYDFFEGEVAGGDGNTCPAIATTVTVDDNVPF